jgi:Flp pilus assembly pilin Flp
MSHTLKTKLKNTTRIASTKGVSVVEYSILLGLIGAVAVGTILTFGFNLTETFNTSQENLEAAQGVGDGTYLTFDDAVNERRCYIATDSNDNVNTSDLEPDDNCVYLLKGNDTSDFSGTTGLSVYPGPGVDDLSVNGASDMTVFFESGYDTYTFVGGGNPNLQLPFALAQATFAPDDLDSNPQTNGWLSYTISGPDGTVKVVESLRHDASNVVEGVTFSDGTTYTPLQIFESTLQSQMTSGDDAPVYGTSIDDTLTDMGGNDNVTLGSGDDTYIWTAGNDTVDFRQGTDTLVLQGFNYADANFSIDRYDMFITLGGDTITLTQQARYAHTAGNAKAYNFVFDDQTITWDALAPVAVAAQVTAGESRVEGTGYDETITLNGTSTIVSPGDGDDRVVYDSGNLRIHGDINGYQLNRGTDVLDLTKYASTDVTVNDDFGDAEIFTPDGVITIEYQFAYASGAHPELSIDSIEFSDITWGENDLRAAAGL